MPDVSRGQQLKTSEGGGGRGRVHPRLYSRLRGVGAVGRTGAGAGLVEAFAKLFHAFELFRFFDGDGAVGILFAKLFELLVEAFAEFLAFGFAFFRGEILEFLALPLESLAIGAGIFLAPRLEAGGLLFRGQIRMALR